MKKLKTKVFWTLFFILTSFLITVSVIFNSQNYIREVRSIENNLEMMNKEDNRPFKREIPEEFEVKKDIPQDNKNKMFMDVILYSIKLDENNEISEIVCHNEENTDTEKIEEYVKTILEKDKDEIHIGNLYFEKYSYNYQKNNSIIIIDNTKTNELLRNSLLTTLIICVILEILIVIISRLLTKWIIKPVEESFTKQKQFIADASHELKTPLSVIMASSEALEKSKDDKWIKSIQNESDRMNNLIKSLLDLAKLEDPSSKKNYIEENISKIIEKKILSFESLLFENNINLDYKIDEDVKLNCDSTQIKELISILIDNAIKHSTTKGEIKVYLKNNKNNITLEVINKGNPIPEGMEEKIFERFYRADLSRNRDSNRYGLGLAIAKNIVLNHNGEISAKSSNGYTTFKIIIKK